MSQRTRARTTGAAPKPTKPVAAEPEEAAPTLARRERRRAGAEIAATPEEQADGVVTERVGATLSPDALARALRAVAAELERDPALARRVTTAMGGAIEEKPGAPPPSKRADTHDETPVATVGRTFHPSIVTGVAPDLGAGVPDPFALVKRLGAEGLRSELEGLRLGSLRAIIREHKLDPGGRLSKLNDAAKLRERILQATLGRK